LIQDELQRASAVSAARRGAAVAQGQAIANTGQAIGGVVAQL